MIKVELILLAIKCNTFEIIFQQPRFEGGVDRGQVEAPAPAAAPDAKTIQGIFDKLGAMMNEELIKKVQAVYTFKVKGW